MKLSWKTQLDRWQGDGGWFFVRLPKDNYGDLQEIASTHARGFGAIKVQVTIGDTQWKTSVFPDSKDKSYILFVKKSVCEAENLQLDDTVQVSIKVIEA